MIVAVEVVVVVVVVLLVASVLQQDANRRSKLDPVEGVFRVFTQRAEIELPCVLFSKRGPPGEARLVKQNGSSVDVQRKIRNIQR